MPVCLIKEKINEFKKALKGRELKVEDLLKMSTEERISVFEKYAGENASDVNLLFEQKLILKNKIQGIKNALSKIGEIGKYDPMKKIELEKALEEFKAKQSERIFNPKEEETFLNALADKKLGTHITEEQAKTIFDLTEKTSELFNGFDKTKSSGQKWESPKAKAEYGASKVVLGKYLQLVKEGGASIKDTLKARGSEFRQEWKEYPVKAIANLLGDTLKTISNNMISIVATLDNSFLGRQGLKVLLTKPSIWWNGAKNSFIDIAKTFKGEETRDALMADIYSSENYINGMYEKAKLIPKSEEQFPTSLPERIPFLGKAFKASQVAFEGSALRMRTGLFDWLVEKATGNGLEITDAHIVDFGKLTNSLTARDQGKITESGVVRLFLWAPRMLKANLDVLTGHGFGKGLETSFARKQAGINVVKVIGETAILMMIANAIKPGSAELDPRSSDFGKIKIGNTRFDITGGAGSIVVLSARIASALAGKPAYKSTSTGKLTKLNTGEFGSRTAWDVLLDFLTNKTNPPARLLVDALKGENWIGEDITFKKELLSLTPISIQNIIDLKDDNSVNAILGIISDALGVSANTYVPVPPKEEKKSTEKSTKPKKSNWLK